MGNNVALILIEWNLIIGYVIVQFVMMKQLTLLCF